MHLTKLPESTQIDLEVRSESIHNFCMTLAWKLVLKCIRSSIMESLWQRKRPKRPLSYVISCRDVSQSFLGVRISMVAVRWWDDRQLQQIYWGPSDRPIWLLSRWRMWGVCGEQNHRTPTLLVAVQLGICTYDRATCPVWGSRIFPWNNLQATSMVLLADAHWPEVKVFLEWEINAQWVTMALPLVESNLPRWEPRWNDWWLVLQHVRWSTGLIWKKLATIWTTRHILHVMQHSRGILSHHTLQTARWIGWVELTNTNLRVHQPSPVSCWMDDIAMIELSMKGLVN